VTSLSAAANGETPAVIYDVAQAATRSEAPAAAPSARRTVTIKGRGAERNLPWESGIAPRRPARPPHHRSTFRPDRLAMWAVFLGLLLVLVASMSAH